MHFVDILNLRVYSKNRPVVGWCVEGGLMDNKKRRERMDYFDRKSEILDMARSMFISTGYENTSINDLIKNLV